MADGGVMLRCALRYAKLGLRVVPCWWPAGTACAYSQGRGCRSPAKHPLIAKWQDAATTDGDTIRSWWSHWPVANIGAVLGPHRLLLDADKAKNGLVTLARLEREHTPLPVEWSAVSGGGGRHHLFTLPDGLTITSRPERFGPGLTLVPVRPTFSSSRAATSPAGITNGVSGRWKANLRQPPLGCWNCWIRPRPPPAANNNLNAMSGHCQVNDPEAVLPWRSSKVSPFQHAHVTFFQSVEARSLRSR